jgi:glutamate racemase
MTAQNDARLIGILDSGVGGLSILREVRALLPAEHILFVGDQAHVPYGPRSIDEVRTFAEGIARYLIEQGVKIVVVACNAASAAALYHLRDVFPTMPFVGMEPAVKPAARDTKTGVIGVIATQATFQGELYASVVGRFAQDVQVEKQVCPEFVLLAESGDTDSPAAHETIRRRLAPLLDAGIDQLVLGCTHFPFLKDAIQAEIGPGVTIVDPSPAVARQVMRVLADRGLLNQRNEPGHTIYNTSGDPVVFRSVLRALLGDEIAGSADGRGLRWDDGRLDS